MSKASLYRVVGVALLAVVGLTACEDGVSVPQTSSVRILLTDAPSDYIGAAMVDIGLVELLPSGDGERITLSEDGTDGPVNLLDLAGLTTEVLADLEIPSGTYHQLRLFVESASVTLAPGYEFEGGSTEMELRVPSGASSGIKLKLRSDGEEGAEDSAGVEISGGETVLVVDFDVNQSFRIQGNPNTPAGIKGVSFQPTLRVVVQNVAGSVSGTIFTALAGAAVEGLVVTATTVDPGDNEDFQSQTATASTDENGAYVIYFLPPGDYQITVETGDPLTTTSPASDEVTVGASEDVTDVDFEVITSP